MAGSKQGVHVIWIAIDFLARVVWGIFKKKIVPPRFLTFRQSWYVFSIELESGYRNGVVLLSSQLMLHCLFLINWEDETHPEK